jgi:hypothetical protein
VQHDRGVAGRADADGGDARAGQLLDPPDVGAGVGRQLFVESAWFTGISSARDVPAPFDHRRQDNSPPRRSGTGCRVVR